MGSGSLILSLRRRKSCVLSYLFALFVHYKIYFLRIMLFPFPKDEVIDLVVSWWMGGMIALIDWTD